MADQDLVPGGVAGRLQMGGPMQSARAFINQPAVRSSLPLIGTLSAVLIAALAWWSFQMPPQRPLFEGLAEADKASVASALQSAGIDYSLAGGSGAISVGEGDFHRARMLLAGQGLPKATPSGDALISALPMGASRAVEGQTLKSAREADLARTIEAIDQVAAARVHLATPEPSLFVRETTEPAASVMLRLQPGRSLSEAQVRAIRFLVASSVPGLNAEQVSVVDQSGALLSQQGRTVDDRNFDLQTQMEQRYREALITLLTPVMGAGNFSTEVHVELDRTETQSTRETYPKDDVALRREDGNKSSAPNAPAIGIPGALSNTQPAGGQASANAPQAAQPGAAPAPQMAEQYSRSFDVGREISVTHQPVGRVKRVTVAVALNAGRALKPAEARQIENLVKGAVGFDAQRGDNVVVSSRAFAKESIPEPGLLENPMLLPAAQQIGALVAALFAFFLIGRPLMRALKARANAPPVDTALVNQLLGATAGGAGAVTLDMIGQARDEQTRAELVRSFVQQDPARAAMVVRQLIQDQPGNG